MTISIRSVRLFFLAILFWSVPLSAQTIFIVAHDDYEHALESIDAHPFLVTQVSYSCDGVLNRSEFEHLTNLRANIMATREMLRGAIELLFHKNKFRTISLEITPHDAGVRIHFTFESEWTFGGLKIKGIWVGRDWYRHYYMMESGDIFDEAKHEHSVNAIKDASKQDGFFDIAIESSFIKDEKTKSIYVTMHITKGVRFSVDEVTILIDADESVSREEVALIHDALYEKHLKKLRGSYYAKRVLQEHARAIKRYAVHKGFLSASIDLLEKVHHQTKRVSIAWHINLHKKRNFVFFGNNFFSNAQLLDRMLQFGRSAWILPASILAEELTKAYQAKGFWQVAIDVREENDRSFFVIKEGPRAWIERVEIRNVSHFSARTIMRSCFSKVRGGGYCDQEQIDRALEDIVARYAREGFLSASVMNHEYIPGSKPNGYVLTVTLNEGTRMYLKSIHIPGYDSLEMEGPFAAYNNPRGDEKAAFQGSVVNEQKKWLLDYFHQKGFWHAIIKSEVQTDDDGGTIITWRIVPGEKIVFGKTIVQGVHERTYEYIMRELEYHEGDVWNQELVRRSFTRLKDLQLFDFISFTPLAADAHGARPLLLKVHRDDPFEIRLRAGLELQHVQQYQTFNGLAYRAGGTFIVKNVTDHADQFRADVDLALSHREITLKYWYPWIFSLPCNALMQGYSIKYDQPGFIGSSKNIYTMHQNGFLCGLRHKHLGAELGLNVGFEVARTTLADDSNNTCALALCIADAIDLNPRILGKQIPFFFIEPTAVFDRLDNTLNPRSGTFSLLSLKGMFPTQGEFYNAYFVKILAEHSWFIPFGDVVSAFRLRIGHLFHRVFADIIPSERFYLGGSHSIRSYEADLAPPLGCCITPDGNQLVLPRGGKTMLNGNIELRIPVFKNVYGAVFQDFGILSGDSVMHDAGANFAAGSGFGIRYLTPIGPLRLDLAWKWKKNVPQEGLFNWFLTFGQAF